MVAESVENIPDTEMRLSFVISGNILDECIPTLRAVYLENDFIRELVKYVKIVQQVYDTDSCRAIGEKRNSFVLFTGDEQELGCFWVAKVLLMFKMSVSGVSKS